MKTRILNILKNLGGLYIAIFISFSVLLISPAIAVEAIKHASDFNHMNTGFPLTGAHLRVECETCHVGGLFKGTPTACDGCHSHGRRVIAPVKSANHIVSNAPCEACHTNTVTFLGARFNHIGVQPNACTTCHNNCSMAPCKSSGHVATISSCDTCHRSTAWIPAGFNHQTATPLVANRCAECHNNVTALGKPPTHQTTTLSCDTSGCHDHTNYINFGGAAYDHAIAVPGACGTCHSGQRVGAKTQTPGHIPYSGNGCDNCHQKPPSGASSGTFYPATMNHPFVISIGLSCTLCHSGAYTSQGANYGGAKVKRPGHVTTSAQCNACHYNTAYTSFSGGVMDHIGSGIVSGCVNCHGSGTGGAKMKTPGVHIPTNITACETCHSNGIFTSFQGASATMNHAAETAACSACHTGSAYTSQGSKQGGAASITPITNHVLLATQNCLACHNSYTSWAYPPEKMDHVLNLNTTVCKTCHDTTAKYLGNMTKKTIGSHESSKSTQDCISCHINRYTSWNKP